MHTTLSVCVVRPCTYFQFTTNLLAALHIYIVSVSFFERWHLKTKIMDYNNCSNVVGEILCKTLNEKASFLDKNNIVWKMINGEWVGKRSVWTLDFRSCWLEDTTIENVKSWWCGGKDADYTEVFKRTKPSSIESALKHLLKASANER